MNHPEEKRPYLYNDNQEDYLIDYKNIPSHVAIVMDGNRRWAKKRGASIKQGHLKGAKQIDSILSSAIRLGVKSLTLYSFSTENWNRPQDEINELLNILRFFFLSKRRSLVQEGVQLHIIGDTSRFPTRIQNLFQKTMKATQNGKRINLILALNYGGRDEIRRAIIKIAEAEKAGKLIWSHLTEKMISSFLDTSKWPDPELVIRSSGINRLSNFLIWQSSYSEMVVSETLWPDFSSKDFVEAIAKYQKRQRRFGV